MKYIFIALLCVGCRTVKKSSSSSVIRSDSSVVKTNDSSRIVRLDSSEFKTEAGKYTRETFYTYDTVLKVYHINKVFETDTYLKQQSSNKTLTDSSGKNSSENTNVEKEAVTKQSDKKTMNTTVFALIGICLLLVAGILFLMLKKRKLV